MQIWPKFSKISKVTVIYYAILGKGLYPLLVGKNTFCDAKIAKLKKNI